MKIAFVGKGGSGKSSISWLISQCLASNQKHVLAIDADYNMDLAHNLGWNEDMSWNFLHSAEPDFYSYLKLTQQDYYVDLPNKKNLRRFQFSPPGKIDEFTKKFSSPAPRDKRISLMIMGMVNEESLYGHRCSHAYITSIKYYLPLLNVGSDSVVIVDSVAGTDMVGYGLYLGVDAMVVVVEETRNSIKVFYQIEEIARKFSIPVFAVINKSLEENVQIPDVAKMKSDLGEKLLSTVPFDPSLLQYDTSRLNPRTIEAGNAIIRRLYSWRFDPQLQWERHVAWKRQYDALLKENKGKTFTFHQEDRAEE